MAFTDTHSLKTIGLPWPDRLARRHEGYEDTLLLFGTHMKQKKVVLDQLLVAVPLMSKTELRAAYKKHRKFSDGLWRDYVRLRECITTTSDPELRLLQMSTWVIYVRSTLLEKQIHSAMMHARGEAAQMEEWPEALVSTATDFDYVRLVSVHKNVTVSTHIIGNYSPRSLMLAFTAFTDALDAVGWLPSASAYFMALYWRYALMLTAPERYATGDVGKFAATEFEAPCRLLAPAHVTSQLLDVSERVVFHQLYRIRCLARFLPPTQLRSGLHLNNARDWDAWRARIGVPAFTRALSTLPQNEMLREDVSERFNLLLMGRFMYPGELEQMQFTYPDEGGDNALTALFRLRFEVHTRVMALSKLSPLAHVVPYMKAVHEAADHGAKTAAVKDFVYGDGTYEAYVNHVVCEHRPWELERMLLLLFEVCFDIDYMSKFDQALFCSHSFVDDRSLVAPSDRPPVSVASARAVFDKPDDPWPMFVAIWNMYIIIRGGRNAHVFFQSPHLIDALAVWLALAVQDGHLNLSTLRAPWAACAESVPLALCALSLPFESSPPAPET